MIQKAQVLNTTVGTLDADERKALHNALVEPIGILKEDWFSKHRQRRPAVAALFISWYAVYRDHGRALG